MAHSKRFNPEMLCLARQSREMSQSELARKASVTQGRVSKIENGLRQPTQALVREFAGVLDYPPSFFYQPGGLQTLPITFFRRRKNVPRRTLERIQAEITIHTMTVARLLRAADIESDVAVPDIDVDEAGDAAEVARSVRMLWGMQRGPVPSVVDVVENAGVVVIPCDFGVATIDAIGMKHPHLPPLMFVNTVAPPDRLRFTMAHELGHLVMHDITTETMEDEANLFAAEFLMPEEDIKPHLRNLSLPVLATLKRIWRVSMAALLHRARQLGMISLRAYRSLWKLLSSYGYRKREPADLDPPIEEPTVLRGLIEFHRSNLKYSREQMAEAVNLKPSGFAELYEAPGMGRLQLVG